MTDRLDMGFVVALDMPLSAGSRFPRLHILSKRSEATFSGTVSRRICPALPGIRRVPRPADWVGAAAAAGCFERVGGHSGARRCGSGSYGLRS